LTSTIQKENMAASDIKRLSQDVRLMNNLFRHYS